MGGSLHRLFGIALKEFIQLKRDRLTFAMIVGIPIMQLLLFGFAINSDPKHLPTAIRAADHSAFTRAFVQALKTSEYFRIIGEAASEAEADALLLRGDVQFVLTIPANFSRRLVRGERPALLLEADATDPAATSNALGALTTLGQRVLNRELSGPLTSLRTGPAAFEVRVQRRYNPEGITQHNIVPGLMGVILTMTMVLMTGLAMTRERERGTFENLLATPARPLEVMIGKILPYILIGLLQISLILLAARFIFHVPFIGSLLLLYGVALLFIAANLTLGMTFSTVARNQLQAMQMTFFFFLPSILLSGFMFPFRGMPEWAQAIGNVLPLTHFLRLVRGILLKGATAADLVPHMWPIALFMLVVMALGAKFYKRTLD
ncbi:ABC transporter permease [Magnetofaba australis]|uniref:Putative antibiotic transport system permease protein n=1 Tax=Magnetofaba australis IT-1 TaxID=1434232 RepID=A0A1Y2K7F9_9PROT|nr:ABC transporter permease [Magnetofaba australis]OSM06257.1 putative antibiotic transport system permease protein [Magnetofaba australis IT-1]